MAGAEGEYQSVSFQVPLLRREHKLTFHVGRTIQEQWGCIKVKLAHDEQRSEFMMRMVLRDLLEELENAEDLEHYINTDIAVLKLLDHKHIIKLFQVFSTDDIVYVLLERCPTTLAEKLSPPMPESAARDWMQQLLQGVSYLHQKGLCHRNISPESIRFDPDESSVKLSDFGFAALSGPAEKLATHPEQLAESPYAAPELRDGPEYNGLPCDVYSLGATLFAMLTGAAPQSAADATQLPERAADLVAACLDPDPGKRPSVPAMQRHDWVTGVRIVGDSEEAGFGNAVLITRSPEDPKPLARDEVRRSFHNVSSGLQLDARRVSRASSICDELSPRHELASPRSATRQRLPDMVLLHTPPDVALEPPLQLRSAPEFSLSPTNITSPTTKFRQGLQVDVFSGGGSKPKAPADGDLIVEAGCSDFVASPMHGGKKKRAQGEVSPMVQANGSPLASPDQEQYLREHGVAQLFEAAVSVLLREKPQDPGQRLAQLFAAPPVAASEAPATSEADVKYLRDHGVPTLVSAAAAALINQKPSEPRAFLAGHFSAKQEGK
eukprot:TRINITY_DN15662_c0_g1_i1.p1 TRINITY_DN15662_c0_g1~~TRINITY_DN15662_c0_g1_i1.p1  ORF type:complete len:551 (+),score=177.25 TRINITY_DN15662_c0_g1_i1:97-1749(+)